MQYLKKYFLGSLASSMYFLVFLYLYGMWIDGDFDYFSLPFIFVFISPIYLLIANPITSLVRIFFKRIFINYVPFLTLLIMIVSFLFNYGITVNSIGGIDISGQNFIHMIVFCFFTAFPSVLGVEYSNKL